MLDNHMHMMSPMVSPLTWHSHKNFQLP